MYDIDLGSNIDDIEGGDSSYTENGRYLLRIEEIKPGTNKFGESYLTMMFEIIDALDAKTSKAVGHKVYEYFSTAPPANGKKDTRWKIKSLLKVLYPDMEGSKLPPDMIGKMVSAMVSNRVFKGNEKTETGRYVTSEGWEGERYKIEDGEMVSLDPFEGDDEEAPPPASTRSNGSNGKASARAGKQQKKAPPPPADDLDDEDIDL